MSVPHRLMENAIANALREVRPPREEVKEYTGWYRAAVTIRDMLRGLRDDFDVSRFNRAAGLGLN